MPVSGRILAFARPGAPRNDSSKEPHARPSSTVRGQRHFQKLSFPFSHVEKAFPFGCFTRKFFPDGPGHMQRSALKQLHSMGHGTDPPSPKGQSGKLKTGSPEHVFARKQVSRLKARGLSVPWAEAQR